LSNTLNSIHPLQNSKKVFEKYKNVPEAYLKVAKGMETQFINHMLGEMRKTVKSETPEAPGEAYYKSMLDYERSKMMADTENGVGLKDLILDQIYPQNLRNAQNTSANATQMYKKVQDMHKGEGNE
jgi:Rod binding domain-containing protein